MPFQTMAILATGDVQRQSEVDAIEVVRARAGIHREHTSHSASARPLDQQTEKERMQRAGDDAAGPTTP